MRRRRATLERSSERVRGDQGRSMPACPWRPLLAMGRSCGAAGLGHRVGRQPVARQVRWATGAQVGAARATARGWPRLVHDSSRPDRVRRSAPPRRGPRAARPSPGRRDGAAGAGTGRRRAHKRLPRLVERPPGVLDHASCSNAPSGPPRRCSAAARRRRRAGRRGQGVGPSVDVALGVTAENGQQEPPRSTKIEISILYVTTP